MSPAIPAAGAKTPSTNCCKRGPDSSCHADSSRRAGCWVWDAITKVNNAGRDKTRVVKPISMIAENEAVTAMRTISSKQELQQRELPLLVYTWYFNVSKTCGTGHDGCEVRTETLGCFWQPISRLFSHPISQKNFTTRTQKTPQNSKELFNLSNASLYNAVERIFGVDKRNSES